MQVQKPRQGYKLVKSLFGKYEEIPEEWEYVSIGEICRIKRGASPRPIEDPKYFGNGRGWIRISDVSNSNKYLEKTKDYLSELGESKSISVNEGDIIMSIAATVGKPIILRMKACIHDGFVTFSNLSSNMNTEFLYYLLKNMENKFSDVGQHGTQSNINSTLVSKTKFAKPSQQEQQRIASILSNVDSLIQQTQKEIEQTQRLKKGLMQKLLTKGIGHTKFKKIKWFFGEELEIPEIWNDVHVGKITLFHKQGLYTTQTYSKNGVQIIRVNDLHKPLLSYETMEHLELDNKTLENFKIVKGDFLIARTGNIGNYGIVTENIPCVFISDIIKFIFNSDVVTNHFFGILFESKLLIDQLMMIQQSSSHIHINAETIKSLKIILPPLNEQRRITSIISNVNSVIEKQQLYKSQLENLKKGLMQKLLTGQIRVKV